jgi:outer membrane protein OmpA-like peptidoglycan-associated protein
MINNPTLEIEIAGHVCCADDMPLSVLRAKTVYSYLVKNGISEKRMTYRGYSRNKPIFEDDSFEENARANRRVEIKILKK